MRHPSSTVECGVSAGCGAFTLPRTLPQAEEGGGAALTSADASDTSTFASASARPQLQLAHAFRLQVLLSQQRLVVNQLLVVAADQPDGRRGRGRTRSAAQRKGAARLRRTPASAAGALAVLGAHLPGWLARAHSRHAGLAAHEAGQQQRAAQSLAPGRILRAKEGP